MDESDQEKIDERTGRAVGGEGEHDHRFALRKLGSVQFCVDDALLLGGGLIGQGGGEALRVGIHAIEFQVAFAFVGEGEFGHDLAAGLDGAEGDGALVEDALGGVLPLLRRPVREIAAGQGGEGQRLVGLLAVQDGGGMIGSGRRRRR